MVDNFEGVVEIDECGVRRANQLLKAGYVLLRVGEKAWERDRRSSAPGNASTFIAHDLRYVIGRTAGQLEFPAYPQRAEAVTAEAEAQP